MVALTPGAAGDWLAVLVNLTVLLGGLAAAYKFRVFDVLGHRYRSEVWCASTPTGKAGGKSILFVGNYVIHNTGSRPLLISRVTLELLEPVASGTSGQPTGSGQPTDSGEIIVSEGARSMATRDFRMDAGSSWFRIGAGERSIFPLRCYVERLPTPALLRCTFQWKHQGEPSEFVWLYDPRLPTTWWSEPTPGLPEAYDPSAPST